MEEQSSESTKAWDPFHSKQTNKQEPTPTKASLDPSLQHKDSRSSVLPKPYEHVQKLPHKPHACLLILHEESLLVRVFSGSVPLILK